MEAVPRLRGVFHQWAFFAAIVAGVLLVVLADGPRERLASWIYALALAAMFGASAIYHRVDWRTPARRLWARRIDHSMIFVFIAGSYTPFALLALPSEDGIVLLSIVWCGALAGVLLKMFWPSAPRWVGVPLYLLLGWVAVWFVGPIMHGAGVAALVLLIVGGALYSIGGVLYALKWPDPWPTTFGHHEFFHACTVVAALCHHVAIYVALFA
jgi:hemolysin III